LKLEGGTTGDEKEARKRPAAPSRPNRSRKKARPSPPPPRPPFPPLLGLPLKLWQPFASACEQFWGGGWESLGDAATESAEKEQVRRYLLWVCFELRRRRKRSEGISGRERVKEMVACAAAFHGFTDVLEKVYLGKFGRVAPIYAAAGASLETLKWMREKKKSSRWNAGVCHEAAKYGHLEVLQWLARENRLPVNEMTSRCAAEGGHLELLQWLRKYGCPWDQWTCEGAAKGGHLKVLRWARANGCPWNHWAANFAAMEGHVEVLAWLDEQQAPADLNQVCAAAVERASKDDLGAIRWLLGGRRFGYAASSWLAKAKRIAEEEGAERAVAAAAAASSSPKASSSSPGASSPASSLASLASSSASEEAPGSDIAGNAAATTPLTAPTRVLQVPPATPLAMT